MRRRGIRKSIERLLEQGKDAAKSFLEVKDIDQEKARFYSLMVSEINDRIGFYVSVLRRRKRDRFFREQRRINRRLGFMTKFFMFLILLQMVIVIMLVLLNNNF